MIELPQLKKGEEKFIRTFEEVHKEKPLILTKKEAEGKVKHTLEQIKKEIQGLPEIQREETLHPTMPIQQVTNVLAQALKLALEEGIETGLKFLYQTNNPYLIDAFHDILIGHYLSLLMEKGKIKIQ